MLSAQAGRLQTPRGRPRGIQQRLVSVLPCCRCPWERQGEKREKGKPHS